MTKSQKVRFLIRQHWIADESELTSEQYYEEKMDKYIEYIEKKMDKYIEYLIEKLKEKENFMNEMKELAKDQT